MTLPGSSFWLRPWGTGTATPQHRHRHARSSAPAREPARGRGCCWTSIHQESGVKRDGEVWKDGWGGLRAPPCASPTQPGARGVHSSPAPWAGCGRSPGLRSQLPALAGGDGSSLRRLVNTSKPGPGSRGSTRLNTEQYSLLINRPGKRTQTAGTSSSTLPLTLPHWQSTGRLPRGHPAAK